MKPKIKMPCLQVTPISATDRKLGKWVMPFLMASSLTISVLQTPVAIREIEENELLNLHGIKTTGKIIHRSENYYKHVCKSSVIIEYQAMGKKYNVSMQGCGVTERRLPSYSQIEITYLPERPSVSRATTKNGATWRFSWLTLSGLWLVSLLSIAANILSYKQLKSGANNAL